MSGKLRVAFMLELHWPYKRHTDMFSGMQQFAQEQGWESVIDEHVSERLPRQRTKAIPYDGIIARANKNLFEQSRKLGIPVVNVWFSSPAWKQLPGVFADFATSGRLRAEHLLARGLRRFAAIERRTRQAKTEVAAFRDAVLAAGCSCITTCCSGDLDKSYAAQQKWERQLDDCMSKWETPIGVYAHNDYMGRRLAQACQSRGYRVPEDVAIIGGENDETICLHSNPSLTSIELGFDRVGYRAAQLLHELMSKRSKGKRNKAGFSPRHILVAPQGVVVRESTDFFAVEDELVAAALTFIASNSHRRIGQHEVARAVVADTRTLQRRFSKILNRSVVSTIRQVRIERAKRELSQGNRTLKEIARDAGFGTVMRMYNVFRRELGVTPSAYRKQHQFKAGK